MYIEYIHENTHALGAALQKRVVHLTLSDDLSISGTYHGVKQIRTLARRIAEELDDKRSENPEGNCPGITNKEMYQQGGCNG
jgi:hypothetical protein